MHGLAQSAEAKGREDVRAQDGTVARSGLPVDDQRYPPRIRLAIWAFALTAPWAIAGGLWALLR